MIAAAALLAAAAPATPTAGSAHDFDWELGRWTTELWRLKQPLSGSSEWEHYTGTSVVRTLWGGKANLLELEVDGPRGHLEALSLRLYDPAARQWTLNYSNSAYGMLLGPPTVGAFAGPAGEFVASNTLNGKQILVRFTIKRLAPGVARFEQSYSADGARTWETNWIATDVKAGG
jgi:hypothetical protein